MEHYSKLTKYASYIGTSLIILFFIISASSSTEYNVLLFTSALWFIAYGIYISQSSSTNTYYKFFIVINLLSVGIGAGLYLTMNSSGGYLIFTIGLCFIAAVLTLPKKIWLG